MEAAELNEILRGKVIESIEEGTTPGWIVINLGSLETQQRQDSPGDVAPPRLMLTAYVGGRKRVQGGADEHYATVALHWMTPDHGRLVEQVRDSRDPNMPIASAH